MSRALEGTLPLALALEARIFAPHPPAGRVSAPSAPQAPPGPWSRAQFANFVAYHTLISLANLLNLPLPKGTFFPRRSFRLTVLDRDVARLRMLKDELDTKEPAAVRGYLLGVKALHFELQFSLHQEPDLSRNAQFFDDFERFSTMVSQAETTRDAEDLRNLAYKLSIMLPFFEDEALMRERNATAEKWWRDVESRAG